mmetsp:Transcript_71029/g.208177  ORF Transcript_71029/g.208177 Transcript_71029/m.208177 type:complete len:317 (-) Transcript_71029:17-967(-)
MGKLKLFMHVVLFPVSAALRRGRPAPFTFNRDALAEIQRDFQNVASFFAPPTVEKILEELKRVPISFQESMGDSALPTGKDLPQAVPRRCAIVASGRSVLNATAGRDIDAVDGPVLRLNFARPEGYEAFVGSRTDALLINDHVACAWVRDNRGPPAQVKMVIINSFGKRIEWCLELLRTRFPEVPFFVLEYSAMNSGLQRLMNLVAESGPMSFRRLTSTAASTTGLIAGLFLMNMCTEVLHYGFLESNECPEHYWERRHHKWKPFAHAITKEHILWKVISSTKGVNFSGEGIVSGWPRLNKRNETQQAKEGMAGIA